MSTTRQIARLWLLLNVALVTVVGWHGGRADANAHPRVRHGGEGWY